MSVVDLARVFLSFALAQQQPVQGPDGQLLRPAQDVLDYSVSVDLTGSEPRVVTTVTFRANDHLKRLDLDYCGPHVDRVDAQYEPGSRNPARTALRYDWNDGLLSIALKYPVAPGSAASLDIATSGWPERGLFKKKNRHGDEVVFTDAWPADTRYWMPCEDHPDDKATFSAFFKLPKEWRAIANGKRALDRDGPHGEHVSRWICDVPLYTAVMSFAAGDFAVVDAKAGDVPCEWWLYPQDAEAGTRDCAIHADALAFLAKTIGPYPYAKYAVVQIPTQYGGMENASNTFLREAAIDGTGSNASVLVHELAHQWFGDSVTESDWHDLWLSEGFATYFAAVTLDALGRRPLDDAMKEMRATIFGASEVRARPICDAGLVNPKERLDANAYPKGAWFLHELRRRIGDAPFFQAIRTYYADHRNATATRDDLRKVMDEACGAPLAAFFHEKLERPGFPIVHGAFRRDGSSPDAVHVQWTQRNAAAQDPAPFDLRFGVAVGRPRDGKFEPLAQANVAFAAAASESTLPLPPGIAISEPLAVRLDPDVAALIQFEVEGIAESQ